MFGSPTFAMIDDAGKFLSNLSEDGDEDQLFDWASDRCEQHNIVDQHLACAAALRQQLSEFLASCRASHSGADYPGCSDFDPVTEFQESGTWPE